MDEIRNYTMEELVEIMTNLVSEIEALYKAKVDHEQKINALQMLNINLMNETRIKIN